MVSDQIVWLYSGGELILLLCVQTIQSLRTGHDDVIMNH